MAQMTFIQFTVRPMSVMLSVYQLYTISFYRPMDTKKQEITRMNNGRPDSEAAGASASASNG